MKFGIAFLDLVSFEKLVELVKRIGKRASRGELHVEKGTGQIGVKNEFT